MRFLKRSPKSKKVILVISDLHLSAGFDIKGRKNSLEDFHADEELVEFIDYNKLKEYRDFGGIRLEDDILVTEMGCRLLGKKRIPITPDEVEDMYRS